MRTNLFVKDSSPDYHPPFHACSRSRCHRPIYLRCVPLYIVPETHSFLGVVFSLGLLSSLNPVMIWTITDPVPLARLSHTLL